MNHDRRRPAGAFGPITAVALATALLGGAAGAVQAAPAEGASRPGLRPGAVFGAGSGSGGSGRTVTLVTGDKVTLDRAGKVTGVSAAEGRQGMTFRITRAADGHSLAVPRDAERLLADGTVDRQLFDVTRLVDLGYDDASRPDLPLIVTYPEGGSFAARSLSASGARVTRDLPSVNGDALRARKSEAATLWRTLTGTGADARSAAADGAAKVRKIWLDGKVEASLDRSTAQIGAPAAWAAGYDGTGVTVAVLDTGVDATHPDLKDRVDAQKNFSDTPDTVDRVGHGTHVASTVAGSGARSGGKYKGVAPGARIISGKVLDDSGAGRESDIIAGMQWAVDQGAKVVNLSLGGEDTPETDPVEQAVNRLSADSGTLFVIAAGNRGPAAATIGTPGSAAAALTVGAVDRTDAIADFSSHGPTADGSLKPDLTAPGVDIVAARAAEGVEGDPAADGYVSMSGTSMATPHVAGAAAILAQRHPDWTGEWIKDALTGSAAATPGLSAFAQGTGRTDIARAMDRPVTSSPALGFGTARWPHADDEPVTKEITYRNDGDRPVTLDLAAEAFGEDGKPAAEGMFTVSSQRLTVPAGGTATAAVTADTRAGTADGTFGGSVTATAADTTVRTAFGVNREPESYDLTVRHLDLRGKPSGNAQTGVYGLDGDIWKDYSDPEDGEFTVRLPKGRYALEGRVSTGADPGDVKLALLLHPKFALTRDTTLVMDARKAEPVRITVPDRAAKHTAATLNFGVGTGGSGYTSTYLVDDFGNLRVGQLGARLPAGEAFAQYNGTWTHGAVRYRPAWNRTGDLSGFTAKPRRQDFAELNLTVGAPAAGKTGTLTAAPLAPNGSWFDFDADEFALPHTGTEYVLPGVKWQYAVNQYGAPDADGEPRWEGGQTVTAPRSYTAGRSYTQRFNIGVFGPHLYSAGGEASGAIRLGDEFAAYVPLFSDGAGHVGVSDHTKARSALYADGTPVFTSDEPLNGETHALPAGRHTYRLTTDVSRAASLSAVSTRVTAEWTFRSGHVAGDAVKWLPLSAVRFTPRLGAASTAKAGKAFTVPFTIEGAATARTARKLAVTVSYDDGRTWKPAKTADRKRLELRHPARPGSVSLRVVLTDADGNTLKQTIHRAYRTTS
ncbi:S8 family peptidase [Actinacidiphila glaucinigra]|uniref:Subtilase family protein n=1 Tax=Actinacidiphila glaucinigra TaxID=235986 RepID=A0A239P195_9ACTN|nr:S8 family peptidase [Actinacidiphila glaucinigra]SNT60394.1 Subtilase family protein [Actinacidiphila glaucinigra]